MTRKLTWTMVLVQTKEFECSISRHVFSEKEYTWGVQCMIWHGTATGDSGKWDGQTRTRVRRRLTTSVENDEVSVAMPSKPTRHCA